MSEPFFCYVCVPAGSGAEVLEITEKPFCGRWFGYGWLHTVGLHEYISDAKKEAMSLSLDYPYFVEIIELEFRAGSFYLLEEAPREEPILYYLGRRMIYR